MLENDLRNTNKLEAVPPDLAFVLGISLYFQLNGKSGTIRYLDEIKGVQPIQSEFVL